MPCGAGDKVHKKYTEMCKFEDSDFCLDDLPENKCSVVLHLCQSLPTGPARWETVCEHSLLADVWCVVYLYLISLTCSVCCV